MPNKRRDWKGQKHGRLTFIRPTNQKLHRYIMWEALCDCGTITTVVPYYAASGSTISCGCRKEELMEVIGQHSRKHDPMISSARERWRDRYRELPFEVYLTLSQLPCHYCGRLPHRVYNSRKKISSKIQKQEGMFTSNGLDRVDNTIEHTVDNVVPCCWDCNRAKGTMLYDEFITHIKRMYEHTYKLPAGSNVGHQQVV